MERLICVTIYVFNKDITKALFIDHRKLRKWLPPGGKVDPNETPEDAALRECLEETGLQVTLAL
jgi:8-oxo-dGTP pyrophosphatase MutT (NUDIX family)